MRAAGTAKASSDSLAPSPTSVSRAFRIVDFLTRHTGGVSLTEIARHLQAPVSTTQQLVRQLTQEKLIAESQAPRRYRLGHAAFGLADRILRSSNIRNVAHSHLQHLSDLTGEDTYLGVLDSGYIVYVDKVEGAESIRLAISLGTRRYLHSSAVGKLFLAHSGAQGVDAYIKEFGLPRQTPATITSKRELAQQLKKIRHFGASISSGENVEGVMGIAAPIFDRQDRLVASLCLSGPRRRIDKGRQRLTALVKQAAGAIQKDLQT